MSNPEMNTYVIHTSGGESLQIQGHHFVINEDSGRLEIYTSQTEKDDNWIVFVRGIVAIETRPKREMKTY